MNKSKLKTFAIAARLDLLGRVRDRAAFYGLTKASWEKKTYAPSNIYQKPDGDLLTLAEAAQRDRLIRCLSERGFDYTIEEVAYTWFNRLIAIRYMQQHMLLPLSVRVLPETPGQLPRIIEEAHLVELPGLDMGRVLSLIDQNRTEALYKYLIISLCNALNTSLPQMFETISDYTELLFPDNLLRAESILGRLAELEDDTWDEVQVIGWLYQYYNTELKDETFDLLKKNVKITKDRIGAATQLFTPEWIVRYMVENSLGRLWLEGHPNSSLKAKWRYYLDEVPQEAQVEAQLQVLRVQRAALRPEDVRLIDPCMGSGHILVYAFDLLMDIYRSVGYTDRDAVESILTFNLYGLDVDDRAAQLAYFALMMKACEYDKRFLKRSIQPRVCAIQESNSLAAFEALRGQLSLDTLCLRTANELIAAFKDAKIYGSLIPVNIEGLDRVDSLMSQLEGAAIKSLEVNAWLEQARQALPRLAEQAAIMQAKYDVIVTNPPYMGASGMNAKLSQFVKDYYPDSKSDLFAVFIELCGQLAKPMGYQAMITQHAWMFLSSYETLRKKLMNRDTINMAHLGARAFEDIGGEVVQTTAFVMQNRHTPGYQGSYLRLIEPTTQQGKEDLFLEAQAMPACPWRFAARQDNFSKIPGSPVVYWISIQMAVAFEVGLLLDKYVKASVGIQTGNNEKFIRQWWEVNKNYIFLRAKNISDTYQLRKWYPYNKGGPYRKWHGNNETIIDWRNDGEAIKKNSIDEGCHYQQYSDAFKFNPLVTWSRISSGSPSFRYLDYGSLSDMAGFSIYSTQDALLKLCAFLNSVVAKEYLNILSPTLNFMIGQVLSLPMINSRNNQQTIKDHSSKAISLSLSDWDSFEISYDFKKHSLI